VGTKVFEVRFVIVVERQEDDGTFCLSACPPDPSGDVPEIASRH
jgi:hypothetical protein